MGSWSRIAGARRRLGSGWIGFVFRLWAGAASMERAQTRIGGLPTLVST